MCYINIYSTSKISYKTQNYANRPWVTKDNICPIIWNNTYPCLNTSQPATLLPGLPHEIRSVKYKAIMLQLYLHNGIYVGLGWFQLR